MAFVEWMASPLGRGLRVAFGGLLIYLGLIEVQGVGGVLLAAFGALPIATGLLNVCPIAPLLGAPMRRSPKAARPRT
jgi:hypothetical protein